MLDAPTGNTDTTRAAVPNPTPDPTGSATTTTTTTTNVDVDVAVVQPLAVAQVPWHIVLNPRPPGSAPAPAEALRAHPVLLGRPVFWHEPRTPHALPAVARQAALAAQADGGVVVAVGGDGSINTVARACWPLGVPLGVVALGTFNYFSRQQGLPDDPMDALAHIAAALDTGQRRRVAVGTVNGQLFLVNASLGLYPRLLSEREEATRRWGRSRLVALAAGLWSLLRSHPGQRLRLVDRSAVDTASGTAARTVSTLFVGNNALQLAQVGLPEAEAVGAGAALGVVALLPLGPLAMARLVWRAARGRLVDEPALHSFACRALEVHAGAWRLSQRLRVAFDGERAWMTLPLRFAVAERPLWLVAPTAPAVPVVAAAP